MYKNEVSDRDAFKLYYNKNHSFVIQEFEKAFKITFLDNSEDQVKLDFIESKWTNKL